MGIECYSSKVCNYRELETTEEEEMALEGYMIETIKMLKGKQPSTIRREEEQGDKRARKEKVKKKK